MILEKFLETLLFDLCHRRFLKNLFKSCLKQKTKEFQEKPKNRGRWK